MKKLLYLAICLMGMFCMTSCEDDQWSNGDPEYDHIYYIGFEDWGQFKNDVAFNVDRGSVVAIPMQFYCEFKRNYDVETYYYVETSLTRGTDFEIVDANGSALQPDANGAYKLVWKNALKGVQNVYVKALNGATGSVTVTTFNSNAGITLTNQDVETTIQHTESKYEVRIFTQNYKVKVNIK